MLLFLVGTFAGGVIGVITMCIVSVSSRECRLEERELMDGGNKPKHGDYPSS